MPQPSRCRLNAITVLAGSTTGVIIAPGFSHMNSSFDAIIIGSGFGGAFAANVLVEAGWSVLLIERGRWVPRGPEASRIDNFVLLSPYYTKATGYRVRNGSGRRPVGALFCV